MVTQAPQYSPEPDRCLKALLATGDHADIEFIVEILSNYKGEPFTHEIYKSIIELLPSNSPLLKSISIGLDGTGVVSGGFGFVAAWMRKKVEIEPWLTDGRERVVAFAKRQMHTLDQQIAADQRRAEQDLELRKRNYGEGPSPAAG